MSLQVRDASRALIGEPEVRRGRNVAPCQVHVNMAATVGARFLSP